MKKKSKTNTKKTVKKQSPHSRFTTPFSKLTWEDLKEWAGDRVVGRGKSYQPQVRDLRMTSDGTLLAWVQGTEEYATQVRIDKHENLSSDCTCPYGNSCKHAVATVLVFLKNWENKVSIPQAESTDERLVLLAEEEDLSDDEEDFDSAPEKFPPAIPGDGLVRDHLESMSKKDLMKLLLEGRDVVTEMRQHLLDRSELQDGNHSKLITSARKEIDKVSREHGWSNHWKNEGHTPDYSRVKQRLQTLLDSGQADAVVELGSYLMEKGVEQVGQSNDEGETGMEVSDCMTVVFKAALNSSKPPHEQLLWEIDLRLKDEYALLDGIPGLLEEKKAAKEDWSRVANTLSDRLNQMPPLTKSDRNSFISTYARSNLMRWLLKALERAGRQKKIITVLESETDQTDCYVELVKQLLNSGQKEQAIQWAQKGHVATHEKLPGIARQLEELLREQAEKEKDAPLAASYRAIEFFDRPGLESYNALQKASEKAEVWDIVRERILNYLETGRRPDIHPSPSWPLPVPQLTTKNKSSHWIRFPETSVLIDIAIQEKRMNDVLRWFRATSQKNGHTHERSKVAEAIHETHPDEAIAIWKSLVVEATRFSNVSAYQTAGVYLGKMKKLLTHKKRAEEWISYLTELRIHNARRPRMLDVLNRIEGNRTPIVSPKKR